MSWLKERVVAGGVRLGWPQFVVLMEKRIRMSV